MIEFLILNIPIIGKLTDKELRGIKKYMNQMQVAPGEIVFKEGDKGDYVCFVVDGVLNAVREAETGESISLQSICPY